MWAPIFDQNRVNVSDALAAYIDFLQQFKQVIDEQDLTTSLSFMQQANVIRRVLDGIEKR
jgi:prephenate dehydrogenase